MPARRITTDDQDAQILAKARPDAALAAVFGFTRKQIIDRRYALRRYSRKTDGFLRPSQLAGREAEIRGMLQAGMWQQEIEVQLGVSRGTLSGFIRRRRLREKPVERFDDPRVMHVESKTPAGEGGRSVGLLCRLTAQDRHPDRRVDTARHQVSLESGRQIDYGGRGVA